jgi:hypothetical protein
MKTCRHLIAICLLCLTGTAGATELGGLMDQAKQLGGDSLASMLGNQFGLSADQAAGGLGGIFELAKNQLSSGDFTKIADAIPGIDGYLEQARAMGLLEGSMGDLEDLKSGLGRIGIDAATVDKFLPAALDALGSLGGQDVSRLLTPLLG